MNSSELTTHVGRLTESQIFLLIDIIDRIAYAEFEAFMKELEHTPKKGLEYLRQRGWSDHRVATALQIHNHEQ
jgi:hypothetical protein